MLAPEVIADLRTEPIPHVPHGWSAPVVRSRLFDLESWSEVPLVPAMSSAGRANGALCQFPTLVPQ